MLATNKIIMLLSATSLCFSVNAFAADSDNTQSETSVKMEDVGKKKDAGIDNEITNKKLRAELGSKSKYSMSTNFSYYGGSIDKPLDKERLKLSGQGNPEYVRLSGTISGRYRIDKRQSLTLGTGVTIVQPFHSPQEKVGPNELGHDNYFDKVNVANPSLSYSYAAKFMGVQMINGASVAYYTAQSSEKTNQVAGASVDNTILAGFGKTKNFQLGLVSAIGYDYYNSKTYKGKDVTGDQYDYALYFYPFAEYVINDTYNLRTVFQQFQFYHNVNTKQSLGFDRVAGAQSIGVGISVTRDVFLYPNFQFSTENLSFNWLENKFAKNSTVGLSATINMF